MRAEHEIELDWRGFELHPETPVGGIDVEAVFGPERSARMQAHLRRFAARFGVQMELPARMQNTRRALALGELARSEGRQDAFRDLAMKAYWRDGGDLEDAALLRRIAEDAGLSASAVDRVDNEPEWLARIDAIRREAGALGVTGIPTFVFGDLEHRAVAVVGCQPYEVLVDALRRVAS